MSTTKIKVSNIASVTGTGNVVLSSSPTFTGTVTLPTSLVNVTTSSYPTVRPTLNLDFANSKQLDPRITFVRNSTATYYDGQTTALAEQNLLLWSQDFRTATQWATSAQSAGIAPDGTNTLNLLIEDTSLNTHSIGKSITGISGAYTASFFLQSNTRTYACVEISTDSYSKRYSVLINLSTGAFVSSQSIGLPVGTSYSIQAYGSAYRVSVTATNTSGVVYCRIASSDSSTPAFYNTAPVYTGDGTSSIYIWGAQLEQRSSVTAYTPTTTTAITNYIPVLMTAPANVARFDCDPITRNSLGLLIEESRTNLLTYSATFSSALWLTFGTATKTTDTVVAPDGTITGCIVSGATSIAYVTNNLSRHYNLLSPSTVYTFSLWIKSMGTATSASVSIRDNTTGANTIVVATINSTWQRVSVTATTSASTTSCYFQVGAASADIAIWGAQLEAGAFATSYIPTVASTVTRAADQASMTGTNFSSWYNQAQGTLYAESDDNGVNNNGAATLYNIGASNNNAIAFYGNGTLNTARLLVRLNVVYVINTSSSATTQPIKQAASFKDGAVSCTANGILFVTNVNVNIPHNLDTLYIGYFPGTASYLTGHIRKLSYYPVALSSSNLVALTS